MTHPAAIVPTAERLQRVRASGGFTLIELLVAIAVMALLAILSWRGLDGMSRAQLQTQALSDEVLTLQASLGQWKADLDAIMNVPGTTALDWDGQVLRMTRRGSASAGDGLRVVAWSRRIANGGVWLRWQSPPLTSSTAWLAAWNEAKVWAQNPGVEQRRREVTILPLEDWQLFYFRGETWSNPLSSTGTGSNPQPSVPEGIRVVLMLPATSALGGRLTLDWVRPDLNTGRS
ncbi:MAG: prepilin-type N-terminal cleavage/methylation domain-containing protein [Burkholderiaceae bacterium]|nr:prepilin-type N-terminal cleavage/methylation domain-containing protein [Burkholderiaceae bacterium]